MSFSFLAIVFVFGLIVLIHELGHFLAAKWMGVRVERFSIGFPPRLIGKKVGDTDYCISAIPLGGYVKMSGMIDESLDKNITGADYEFNSKPVWKRMIIITAGVVMNLFLAILILTVINYKEGEVVYPSTEIGYVGKTGVVQRIGFEVGDKIESINGIEVNTWNEVMDLFVQNLNNDIRYDVLRNGETVSLFFKQEWFKEKNAELFDISWMAPAWVGRVLDDRPAAAAGLQWGDEIISIDGTGVRNWSDMTTIIKSHPAEQIQLKYLRDGREQIVDIIPEKVEQKDSLGNISYIGMIGIEVYYERYEIDLPTAVVKGVTGTFGLIALNMKALWWVITGTKSATDVFGGPIMIAKLAQDAAAVGWDRLWSLIAALSAILAFFNILPIPALDGGHLTFLLVEAANGKPVSTRTKLLIQQIGLAILFTLIVFILYIDISNLLF